MAALIQSRAPDREECKANRQISAKCFCVRLDSIPIDRIICYIVSFHQFIVWFAERYSMHFFVAQIKDSLSPFYDHFQSLRNGVRRTRARGLPDAVVVVIVGGSP